MNLDQAELVLYEHWLTMPLTVEERTAILTVCEAAHIAAPNGHKNPEARRKLCQERNVTLNGFPAVISGARNAYATVTALDSGISFEWSWPAVERIVTEGGDFRH